MQHWFEVHTARKYACQLCGSLGHQSKTEEGIADGTFFFPVNLKGRTSCEVMFAHLGAELLHEDRCTWSTLLFT